MDKLRGDEPEDEFRYILTSTDEIAALRTENDKLKALLRELEWFDGGYVEVVDQQVFMEFCPVCEGARPTHAKDCKLAEALR